MPDEKPNHRPVVVPPMRGSQEYDRYLDRLLKAVQKAGVQRVESRSTLVEHALNVLGLQHNLIAPKRAAPHGTNRHGEPKPKAKK